MSACHARSRGCHSVAQSVGSTGAAGGLQGPLWRLEAGAVLDLTERRLSRGVREVQFEQVRGDFKRFSGRWLVSPRCPWACSSYCAHWAC